MKSVTEFISATLNQGLKAKAALTAEGKTPEEIQASVGETFKFEGDKLKHFINALTVVPENPVGFRRVLVVSLNEGENVPHKAQKIEEFHYVPEFFAEANRAPAQKSDGKGGKGRQGGGRGAGGPKESPWGLSPEEKAAKVAKSVAAKAAAAAKAAKAN